MRDSGLLARLLIGVGAGLLIVGGTLAYPYVHSRLARPSSMALATTPPHTVVATTRAPELSAGSGDPDPPQVANAGNQTPVSTPAPSSTPSREVVPTLTPTSSTEVLDSKARGSRDAPPTRIVIPTIGVDGPVIPVSVERTEVGGQIQAAWGVPDEYAAGWHETSAMLGERDNMVLNGHNTNNGEIFRDLYTLAPGDEVVVFSRAVSRTYTVSETLILPEAGQPLQVRIANARYAMPTDDERLTLITCHPYGSLRNRLIVMAIPSEPELPPDSLEYR